MEYTRNKSHGMRKHMYILPVFLVAAIAIVFGPAANCLAGEEEEFEEAYLFFELNDTDGDLGIHALIDGDAWKSLEIEDPKEREMLNIRVKGRLRRQGLTEIFFESAEPTFDELPPEKFFRRFPEGMYEIEGETLEGDELESEVWLSHVMPAPPARIKVNDTAIDPDSVDCEEGPVLEVTPPVTITWEAVTMSHPDSEGGGAGVQPQVPVTIHNYEIVLEVELGEEGEEFTSVLRDVLPPNATSFTVPEEFLSLGVEFKYEVIAREESFNQTAVESCFVLELPK